MNEFEALLGTGGAISKRLPGFEDRPAQQQMAAAVYRALSEHEHLCVEAGTGVGKTLGYLIPAIEHAARTTERIVISTHTLHLQEQLLAKDIPLLNAALPHEFTAVLMKGRNHYIGLRRLEQALHKSDLLFGSPKKIDHLRRLGDWTSRTTDGTSSDLYPGVDQDVWDRVKSEHGNCMGHRCRHYHSCFFQKARRRGHHAQLLVVNHALFFSDLALRQHGISLLPDYDVVILDEAHTVEKVAREHFGATLSYGQIRYLLNTLYDPRTRRGFLATCHAEPAIGSVKRCGEAAAELFEGLIRWQARTGRENGRWTQPPDIENRLSIQLRDLHRHLLQLRNRLIREDDLFELNSMMGRCQLLADLVLVFTEQQREDTVYWLEKAPDREIAATLNARPLNVAEDLKDLLFDNTGSVVLTSATLSPTQDHDFAYFRSRIGLMPARSLKLDSPYEPQRQVRFYVAPHLPDPNDLPAYVPQAAKVIEQFVELSGGRALVLFTSYAMMEEMKAHLQQRLADANYRLHVQGQDLRRSQMLDALRHDPRTILFGTNSFWEGIDVRGSALQTLIITKLPFDPPNNPFIQATIESIQNAGRNPFLEFQLPEAILKFKQGVGRLIRSSTDTGTLVVMDHRICKRHYGRYFVEAVGGGTPEIATHRR